MTPPAPSGGTTRRAGDRSGGAGNRSAGAGARSAGADATPGDRSSGAGDRSGGAGARSAGAGDTRRRILDAALEVIGERGVAGVTNRLVAGRAGVSLGSLTYHFPSQQDVLREALEMFVDREVDRIAGLAAGIGPLSVADAAAAAEQALEEMAAGVESIGVLELYLHAGRDPSIRDAARRCWAAYDRLATAILGALGVADPAAHAPGAVSLIAGTQVRWLATGTHQPGVLAGALARLVGAGGPAEAP